MVTLDDESIMTLQYSTMKLATGPHFKLKWALAKYQYYRILGVEIITSVWKRVTSSYRGRLPGKRQTLRTGYTAEPKCQQLAAVGSRLHPCRSWPKEHMLLFQWSNCQMQHHDSVCHRSILSSTDQLDLFAENRQNLVPLQLDITVRGFKFTL